MSGSPHRGAGQRDPSRIRRVALGVTLSAAVMTALPGIVAGDRPEGDGAIVSARVTVTEPVASSAVAAPAAAGSRWVYTVSPSVTVDTGDGEQLGFQGKVVRALAYEGTSTGGVRRQLEPFTSTDLGDGRVLIDARWVGRHIVTADVPVLGVVRCHRVVFPQLVGALTEIAEAGLDHLIDHDDYGGCWVPRRIDWSPHRPLSMHAWGLAFDINVATNGLGAEPTLDPRIVEVFERWGFAWGGHWLRPDGMHFELARIDPADA